MERFNFDLPDKKPVEDNRQPVQEFEFDLPPSPVKVRPEQAKIEEDPEGYWDWASIQGARHFLEGATFNFADEIGSTVFATYMAMNDPNPIQDTWKQYYKISQDMYKKEKEEFAKESPKTAATMGVLGAIASPASYVAAPAKLSGMAVRAGAEGALFGAGAAESTDDIAKESFEGALWGSGTALATGFLFKGLARKNITKDLDSVNEAGEEVFTPITLAADVEKSGESTIQGLYRDIVAPTYLAKTAIRNQEELILNPLETRINSAKENLSLIGRDVKANTYLLNNKFKETKEQMREGFRQVNARIGEDIKDAGEAIKAHNEVLKNAGKNGLTDYSINMNQQILKDSAGFREQVLNLSFPTNVGSKSRQELVDKIKTASTPQEQYYLIDSLWADAGFETVKKNLKGGARTFPMKMDSLTNAVYKRIINSDKLSARVGNKEGLLKMIDTNLGFMSEKINKGRIKASTLMTNRNELAMKANSFADTTLGDADRAVIRTAVDAIDDAILARLPNEAAKKAFKADKEAWGAYSKFKDAVQMKSKAGEFGMFEPKDYIDVLRKSSKGIAGKGKGLLQEEAEKVNKRITYNQEKLKNHAHEVMRDVTNEQARSLSKLAKQKKAQLEQAKKDFGKQFKGASVQYEQSLNKAQRGIEVQRLETELAELQEHLNLLNFQRSQRNPSWFQSIAAVGLLGGFLVGGTGGAVGAAAIGTGVGGALGSKTGQRFVAGQTGLQTAMRNNPKNTLQTSQLLSRVMAEQVAEPVEQ